jgi:hypothetical protein
MTQGPHDAPQGFLTSFFPFAIFEITSSINLANYDTNMI